MRKKNFTLFVIHCSFFLVLLCGCAEKRPDGMPRLFPAKLTVTLEGNAFPDAMVSLSSAAGGHLWTSGGTTDKSGNLVLYTHGKYLGVPAGKYKVTVDCVTSDVPMPENPTVEQADEHNKKHPPFRIVPLEYTEKDTTPLTIEFGEGKNTLTIDIPKKVKLKTGGPP